MKRTFRLAATLTAVATLTSCGGDPFGPIHSLPRQLTQAESKLIEADNGFALKLFRELDAQDPDVNRFISPLSVGLALGMTYNGASGATRDGMAEALELRDMSTQEVNEAYRDLMELLLGLDPQVQLQIANSIWYREGMAFEQAFLDVNREYFEAMVAALDFASPGAARTINDWVSDNTDGNIDQIVPDPIPANIVMFLINAIHFKGDWTHQFDRELTRETPFAFEDGTTKQVETMFHTSEVPVRVSSDDLVRAVDLSYGGDAFRMTVLVPHADVGLDAVISNLDAERWRALTSGLSDDGLVVGLPKFSLEYDITLNDVLTALGMGDAFAPGADFSSMRRQNDLFISFVKHKTFVEVDEEGTTASAATVVAMAESAGPTPFLVNRPFLFVIRERFSGTILFMGKVLDPDP